MDTKEIMSLNELSGYLSIPKSTLYKLSQYDGMPSFKVGRQLRFRKDAIDKWIRAQEIKKKRRKVKHRRKE